MVDNFLPIFCWENDLPTVFVVSNFVGKFNDYFIVVNFVGKLHAFVPNL